MSHTPGTWYAKDGQIYPEETGKTLAVIPYFDPSDKEAEANAQLISTAPDLLEALEDAEFLLRQFSAFPGPMQDSAKRSAADARAAIAKAKGE
jgi:hypothetical protein